MTKGEQTREMILERSAQLFSRQGYFGSSLSDILKETGLEKGGIYNHFSSKEELALEAFDYSLKLVSQRFSAALENKDNSIERLLAIVSVFRGLAEDPPLPGGCPVLNTAIESDDAHPALRERARKAMDSWFKLIMKTVNEGISKGEIQADVNGENLATIMISTLEGAVMLCKLYGKVSYMRQAVDHLTQHIETSIRN